MIEDRKQMESIALQINDKKSKIAQYETELAWLIQQREQELNEYYNRIEDINIIEANIDDINAEIDERVIVMDDSREEALGLAEVLKNMPMISSEERRELSSSIRDLSMMFKKEKSIIEGLLDELDEMNERIKVLTELGDRVLVSIDERIATKEAQISEMQQEIYELEVKFHESIVKIIDDLMDELKKRSAGNACASLEELLLINPDLINKIEMVNEKAEDVLGMTLEDYMLLNRILK